LTPKNRIPELDAARGICILSMVAVHLVYDLTELYPLIHWNAPPFFTLLQKQGGIVFFLISGICVTLGASHLRRGMQVLGCAALVSAATNLSGSLPIRFGVLHCLGCCMLLWHFFKNASAPALCLWGAPIAAAGSLFRRLCVSSPYLYPLGLTAPDFASADYFPLLPFFGFFLAGAALGRRLYPNRQSLFPSFPTHGFFRFLCACGRHSLWIYLLHQPILLFLIETALA
jgi:uncharacterized membrane protein